MSTEPIKLIIVDDHHLFTEGLLAILKRNSFIEVLKTCEDGKILIEYLENNTILPDIILLDIAMPQMNGFEVLKYLNKNYKSIKCIVLSMHNDSNYIAKCTELGAWGYLLKNTDTDELINAIDIVHSGEKYFNQDTSKKMIEGIGEMNKYQKLTKKEIEIYELISKGLTTKEIANNLFISVRTVETHRANILKKLEVRSTIEMFQKSNIIELLKK